MLASDFYRGGNTAAAIGNALASRQKLVDIALGNLQGEAFRVLAARWDGLDEVRLFGAVEVQPFVLKRRQLSRLELCRWLPSDHEILATLAEGVSGVAHLVVENSLASDHFDEDHGDDPPYDGEVFERGLTCLVTEGLRTLRLVDTYC